MNNCGLFRNLNYFVLIVGVVDYYDVKISTVSEYGENFLLKVNEKIVKLSKES